MCIRKMAPFLLEGMLKEKALIADPYTRNLRIWFRILKQKSLDGNKIILKNNN